MTATSHTDSGWLLEHESQFPRPRWLRAIKYSGNPTGELMWTEDAATALRFARRVDAVDFAWLFPEWCVLAKITEHTWSDPLSDDRESLGNKP